MPYFATSQPEGGFFFKDQMDSGALAADGEYGARRRLLIPAAV